MSEKCERTTICADMQKLGAFRDNQLPPQEHLELQAHLTECTICQARLEELRALSATLQTYSVPQTSWATEQPFWKRLAPRLSPRHADMGQRVWHPWAVLAPLGLAICRAALETVLLLISASLWLRYWHLPRVDVTPLARVLTESWLWEASARIVADAHVGIVSISPHLAELWIVVLWGAALTPALLLSAIYLTWLVRWMYRNDRINAH